MSTLNESQRSDSLVAAIADVPSERRLREAPPEWQQFSASELANILDEAYAAEVELRRSGEAIPRSAERDAGQRFFTGLLVGIPVGLAIWGAIIGIIIAIA